MQLLFCKHVLVLKINYVKTYGLLYAIYMYYAFFDRKFAWTVQWPLTFISMSVIDYAPWWCSSNFISVIFRLILQIDILGISCEIALRWMPENNFDDQSTMVHVMAWCRQATSHYLSQCWPRSRVPCGAIRPQWVKTYIHPYPF